MESIFLHFGRKLFIGLLVFLTFSDKVSVLSYAKEVGGLYASSAVLMDGESGRILYEKNGDEFLANASTTKILTCILALENSGLSEHVTVSSYAATMPDVQLNIREGEEYIMEDLLFSLMLESHNDSAVAIAEHIAGSCENFSLMMNEKAVEIGCKNTCFFTPNGLDATKGNKYHGTTAADLSLIMRYCIKESPKKEDFLRITRTPLYQFSDLEGTRSFSCYNRNSFLSMMEGALSGKTGFTSKAGYCYVGALIRDGKTYIVSLLACGWPGNKHYKWEDAKKLMEYGINTYKLYSANDVKLEKDMLKTEVYLAENEEFTYSSMYPLMPEENEEEKILLKEGEEITVNIKKRNMTAPVNRGDVAGEIIYSVNGKPWIKRNLIINTRIEKIDYNWCFKKVLKLL